MDHPQFVEHAEPGDVFTLLSDDNRIDIVRALWNSDGQLTFSALHDAVDIRDSGQFNYHLDKLVGQFVTKTEEGYELTAAGRRVNGAIEAGSYTASGRMDPISLDPPCPTCGGTRTFYYENEEASVKCDTCDVQADFSVPPSTFIDCDREEIPGVAGEYLRTILDGLDNGFCSQCDGPVERTVSRATDSSIWDPLADDADHELGDIENIPVVEYECLQCGMEPTSGLTFSLLNHPEVVEFYYDRGIDIRTRSLWEFTTFGTEHERVRSDDPFRACATFVIGDDELTLVVDEELSVVDTTSSSTGEP